MTTVSALPPSTAPAKAGGTKTKSAAEGGDDFAAMLAGMTGTATSAAAPVTTENGAPAGGLPGAPVLVLDLSQLDAAVTPAQTAPMVLPTQVAGQLAGQAPPALVVAPAAVPTVPAAVPVAETAAVAAPVDAAPAPVAPGAVPVAPGAAPAAPDVAAAVTAVTTPTVAAAQPTAATVAVQPATDPTATVTDAAAAADAVAEVAPTGTAAAAEAAEPTVPTSLQAPAVGDEAEAAADVQPIGQESASDASGEQGDAPLPQSAPAPVETVRSSAPVAAETSGPAPVTESRPVTAPAAPAPAAPAPPPATQVVTQLAPVLEGPDGAYTMSLQLYPEELGAVQVEISLRGGEISLALHAADDVSKELLRASLPQLREQLEATGLTATDVTVDSGASEEREPTSQQRSGTRGGGPEGDGAADAAPALPTDPDAALDVRI